MGNDCEDQKACVLIIDDDRLVRTSFARGLRRHYDVIEANNGREGLGILASSTNIDVVVTDLLMAGMDGRSLYFEISKQLPHLVDRVLFITGGSVNEEFDAFVRQMGDAVLVKPILHDRLVAAIQRVLSAERSSPLAQGASY